jgi:hypothetical protein
MPDQHRKHAASLATCLQHHCINDAGVATVRATVAAARKNLARAFIPRKAGASKRPEVDAPDRASPVKRPRTSLISNPHYLFPSPHLTFLAFDNILYLNIFTQRQGSHKVHLQILPIVQLCPEECHPERSEGSLRQHKRCFAALSMTNRDFVRAVHLARRSLDTLSERDIITFAHHNLTRAGSAEDHETRSSSASFGLPVGLLLFGTGYDFVRIAETSVRLDVFTGGIEWKQRTFVR